MQLVKLPSAQSGGDVKYAVQVMYTRADDMVTHCSYNRAVARSLHHPMRLLIQYG